MRNNFLKERLIPCWYELSFLKEEMALLVRIHLDFIKNFKPIPQIIAEKYIKKHGFDGFIGGLNYGSFGFNGIMNRRDEKDGFAEFIIKVPVIKWLSEEKCEECSGSGVCPKGAREGDRCSYCGGEGKKTANDWKPIIAISASLSLLFQMIEFPPETNTSAPNPQLMIFRTVAEMGQDNSAIWAEYGIPVCNWLLSQKDNTELPEVARVVAEVYSHMFPSEKRRHIASACIHGGHRLSLKCSTGQVFTDGLHVMKRDEGCTATNTEIDNPAMQFSLLAGLAVVCDIVREEMRVGT